MYFLFVIRRLFSRTQGKQQRRHYVMKNWKWVIPKFIHESFYVLQVKSQPSKVNKLFLFSHSIWRNCIWSGNQKSLNLHLVHRLRKRGKSQLFLSGLFNNIISIWINIQVITENVYDFFYLGHIEPGHFFRCLIIKSQWFYLDQIRFEECFEWILD